MLDDNKKELTEDELDEVTGGRVTPNLTLFGCEYFYQAIGKGKLHTCKNCFYYHQVGHTKKCTEPRKAAQEQNFI